MRKQILLIDDDLPLCRKLRDALQDDTTEVRYFIDTAEALDSFMRHRYCLVIIDPALEDMDGRELLRTMRQAKVVPILVLTKYAIAGRRSCHSFIWGNGLCAEAN